VTVDPAATRRSGVHGHRSSNGETALDAMLSFGFVDA